MLLIESPVSPRLHVNSRHVSATRGHHQVYMMTCVNSFSALKYYVAMRVVGPKVYYFKEPDWSLLK
jgi:hypothetical protein